MLHTEISFPFSGSRGFERATGRPFTILRRNLDGTMFVRLDDVPAPRFNIGGRASGNTTLDQSEVVATLEETGSQKPTRKAATKHAPRQHQHTGESSQMLAGKPRQSRRARTPKRVSGGAV